MRITDPVEPTRPTEDGVLGLYRWRHTIMKRLLAFFTLPLVLVACDTQPAGVETVDAQFAKAGNADKPEKPPKPASDEWITFTGDLEGEQIVAGCCPNAGPYPEYTMTFSEEIEGLPDGVSGEHAGNIFMNSLGRKVPGDYVVQFWWGAEPDGYFIEIRGGELEYDKRTRILTVTFIAEEMTIDGPEGASAHDVSFVLTRAPTG
jgi:hypothetical protein